MTDNLNSKLPCKCAEPCDHDIKPSKIRGIGQCRKCACTFKELPK